MLLLVTSQDTDDSQRQATTSLLEEAGAASHKAEGHQKVRTALERRIKYCNFSLYSSKSIITNKDFSVLIWIVSVSIIATGLSINLLCPD